MDKGTTYYVRTDHIGRPVFGTNGAGAKVWEASYKPFGGVDVTLGGAIDLRFPHSRAFAMQIPAVQRGSGSKPRAVCFIPH